MARFRILFVVCGAIGLSACGGYSPMSSSSSSSLTPAVSGKWTVMLAANVSQGTMPPSTGLTVNFNQNGSTLTGTVTAVNNPANSCFPLITATGTTFNVSGQVSPAMQSGSNLSLTIAFMSGSSSGTVTAAGTLAYLGTSASGTFSFPAGSTGCTSGTFTMTQTG